jgi:hypothetical protein
VDTGYALVGFPVAVAALVAARGFATVERAWLPAVLRRPLPTTAYLRAEGRPVPRLTTPLRDPQAWLDALHAIVRFPLAVLAFAVTVSFWSIALGGLTYWAWDWALPHSPDNVELPELLGFQDTAATRIAFYAVIGILAAVLLPFALRGVAVLQASLGRVLLTSRAATQAKLGRLTEGRNAAVAAEAVALRRLERDIHDGTRTSTAG